MVHTRTLEDRFLAFLITLCAKAMNWFAVCHRLLQRAHKNARWQFLQLVTLLLGFPCFQASHFFFKRAYALQQRRALVLRCKRGIVGVDQLGLELEELGLEGLSIA